MRFNSDKIKIASIIIISILLSYFIGYQLWSFGKKISYNIEYEEMVIKTIESKVKKNCLR